MSFPDAHSDFSLEMSCLVSTHLVKVSRVASMMGAVSLVTFIGVEGAGVGVFVCEFVTDVQRVRHGNKKATN